MEKEKKTHRAWSILVACCFLMMTLGLTTTILGFFIQAVSDSMGFERSAFSLYYTLGGLAGLIAMPIWGRVVGKIGARKTVLICGTGATVFVALLGCCQTLPMFYAAGIGMGTMIVGINTLPVSVLINTWFVEKRGFAMGIAMAFSGVSGTVFSPVVSGIIQSAGWRMGYFADAALLFLFTVPIALLLIKDTPAQLGLQPYGAKQATEAEQAPQSAAEGVPAGRALKSPAFIVLAIAIVLINAVGAMLQNLSGHITNLGIDAGSAALAVSVVTLTLIFAKILLGIVNDKFGTMVAVTGSFLFLAAGCATFAFAQDFTVVLVAAVLFGLGASGLTVMAPLIVSKMFGQKDYSSIYSVIGAMGSLGLAIGVPLIALDYDVNGSYITALLVCAVVMVGSIFLIAFAIKASKRLWGKEAAEMPTQED